MEGLTIGCIGVGNVFTRGIRVKVEFDDEGITFTHLKKITLKWSEINSVSIYMGMLDFKHSNKEVNPQILASCDKNFKMIEAL